MIAEREEYLKSKEAPAAKQGATGSKPSFQVRDAPWSNDAALFPSLASSAAKAAPVKGAWARR